MRPSKWYSARLLVILITAATRGNYSPRRTVAARGGKTTSAPAVHQDSTNPGTIKTCASLALPGSTLMRRMQDNAVHVPLAIVHPLFLQHKVVLHALQVNIKPYPRRLPANPVLLAPCLHRQLQHYALLA